jgi:hypothetical protein
MALNHAERGCGWRRCSRCTDVCRSPDGYSLPAQREACERKAEQLDAEVVETFIDRGESAKTADRRESNGCSAS